MDEVTKKLVEENLALNRDNNAMLKKLVVYQKWAQILKVVTWAFIILTAVGGMYFIQKNLGTLMGAYTGGAGITDIGSITKTLGDSTANFKSLLEDLNR